MNRWSLLGISVALIAALAPTASAKPQKPTHPRYQLKRIPDAPGVASVAPDGIAAGATIFLNRCGNGDGTGSCVVHPGTDDAPNDTSSIPDQLSTLAEHQFAVGEWEAVVACVKEVYSPFNVHVVDQRPTGLSVYEQIVVAGKPSDIGVSGAAGIASIGCSPNPRGMAFALTSAVTGTNVDERVDDLCWTIAQETAHNFGLFHQYAYVDDNASACNDPMTYRTDCGGQKFFRNRFAYIGTFSKCDPADPDPNNGCGCNGAKTQNSHQALLAVFGEGQSTVPAPSVSISLPVQNGALGAVVAANAGSHRGVARVDWYFNDWKWGTSKGAPFGSNGQLDPSSYQLTVPTQLPNSKYDIVAKAYDDLDIETDSAVVTAMKGAPCADASTCLTGQKCDAGKCYWEQPVAEVGDTCTFNEACKSNLCAGTDTDKICTQSCIMGSMDSCPDGLECTQSGTSNVCYPASSGGGCCSVGDSDHTFWHAGLSLGVLGLLLGRRRSRKVA
ncbi:hypothetical protein BH11MYX2_BH11MYX2_26440 [soil metagenome]